jgi:hypothetical protein
MPVNTVLLQKRGLATAAEGAAPVPSEDFETKPSGAPLDGPMREYDVRVEEGRLRDDPYQRGRQDNIIQSRKATVQFIANEDSQHQESSKTSRTSSKR